MSNLMLPVTVTRRAPSWLSRAASAAERARVNATRTIGGVIKKIGELSPRLGGHLRAPRAGDLVERPKDWHRVLKRLATDDDYRAERAQHGKRVASRLTIEEHADEYVAAWQAALDHAAPNKVSA